MKAIVYTEYGSPDVLQIEEVEKPAPKDNEVLIRVQATPVNFGDLLARNFKAFLRASSTCRSSSGCPRHSVRVTSRRKISWAASSPEKLKRSAQR